MTHKTKFDDRDMQRIENMASRRLPNDLIAAIMGISHDTFERMMKTDPALRACVLRGRANASNKARGILYEMATGQRKIKKDGTPGPWITKPDPQLLKFWCQTQEGFKITDKLEHTGADGKPIETAQLTKAERLAAIRALDKKLKITEDE